MGPTKGRLRGASDPNCDTDAGRECVATLPCVGSQYPQVRESLHLEGDMHFKFDGRHEKGGETGLQCHSSHEGTRSTSTSWSQLAAYHGTPWQEVCCTTVGSKKKQGNPPRKFRNSKLAISVPTESGCHHPRGRPEKNHGAHDSHAHVRERTNVHRAGRLGDKSLSASAHAEGFVTSRETNNIPGARK